MPGRDAILRGGTAALAAVALTFAGCGGGERQDAGDEQATFPVELVRASFPARQELAGQSELQLTVRNTGKRVIPNLTATIESGADGTETDAFASLDRQAGLSSRSRPVWIVDHGPHSGDTAYANTWALGRLGPGRESTFVWRVTPIRSGRFEVAWSVDGSLPGGARLRDDGRPVRGAFQVRISRAPGQARVTADGDVERVPAR